MSEQPIPVDSGARIISVPHPTSGYPQTATTTAAVKQPDQHAGSFPVFYPPRIIAGDMDTGVIAPVMVPQSTTFRYAHSSPVVGVVKPAHQHHHHRLGSTQIVPTMVTVVREKTVHTRGGLLGRKEKSTTRITSSSLSSPGPEISPLLPSPSSLPLPKSSSSTTASNRRYRSPPPRLPPSPIISHASRGKKRSGRNAIPPTFLSHGDIVPSPPSPPPPQPSAATPGPRVHFTPSVIARNEARERKGQRHHDRRISEREKKAQRDKEEEEREERRRKLEKARKEKERRGKERREKEKERVKEKEKKRKR